MSQSSIERESRLLSTISSDIDKYRNRYFTSEIQIDGNKVNISLVAPKIDILENYRFYIYQNCNVKPLDYKYRYRPDYLSYYEYGTTNWWALLMWINDCKSLEYFTMENVLVPTQSCLTQLTLETQKSIKSKSFNEDEFQYSIYSILYRSPVDKLSLNGNSLLKDTVSKLSGGSKPRTSSSFEKEQFLLDIPKLRLRFIDLKYEPDINSLSLIVKCKPNLIYGKHYIIIKNDDNKNLRLTWDPKYVSGSGLVFRLKENDIIQVTYVRK